VLWLCIRTVVVEEEELTEPELWEGMIKSQGDEENAGLTWNG